MDIHSELKADVKCDDSSSTMAYNRIIDEQERTQTVTEIDLTTPELIDASTRADLNAALYEHGVIVFRGTSLTPSIGGCTSASSQSLSRCSKRLWFSRHVLPLQSKKPQIAARPSASVPTQGEVGIGPLIFQVPGVVSRESIVDLRRMNRCTLTVERLNTYFSNLW